MVELRLDVIAAKMSGRILQGDPTLRFRTFNIDSRLSELGELFFAIVAKRNGHDFVPDAREKGARGAVVAQDIPRPGRDFALVRVADTLAALQTLARSVLVDHPVKVIGITGSIGKTTTKEFTAGLLGRRLKVLKSEGNFNNHLGLALSLLRLAPEHEAAVLEMGTSAPGEILALTRVAPPDIAVITNINPVHLEFFHSLQEIALAKREILDGSKKGATAVLNGDDPWVRKIGRDWRGPKITYGLTSRSDIRASSIRKMGAEGMAFELRSRGRKERVRVPFLYEDYLYDLLAAVGVSLAIALPFEEIIEQIPRLHPFSGRGGLIRLGRGIRLVDDSYNSSPKAVEAALKGLAAIPAKRRIAVLGDMLELGETEVDFHRQAGKQVAALGWDLLLTIGPLARHLAAAAQDAGLSHDRISSFGTSEEAAAALVSLLQDGDLILVKGSRGMRTERVVERLREELKEN
jgi:UDP-N-acetylmuramoyl-tripeptide--D-alanyl-D-alanine ligase